MDYYRLLKNITYKRRNRDDIEQYPELLIGIGYYIDDNPFVINELLMILNDTEKDELLSEIKDISLLSKPPTDIYDNELFIFNKKYYLSQKILEIMEI